MWFVVHGLFATTLVVFAVGFKLLLLQLQKQSAPLSEAANNTSTTQDIVLAELTNSTSGGLSNSNCNSSNTVSPFNLVVLGVCGAFFLSYGLEVVHQGFVASFTLKYVQ